MVDPGPISYSVTATPGNITAIGTTSPITVTGLTNGTAYTFSVTATNAIGSGPASPASAAVTPAAPPGASAIGIATPGNGQATVNFGAPSADGGSPIFSYTVTASPGGNSVTGPASPLIVTGLTNGITYTFSVTATNNTGQTGPASANSNSITPVGPPGAPTIGAAIPGNGQAMVNFFAPSTDGGSPIATYTVTVTPGGLTVSFPAPPLIVTGLTNGAFYSFTVTANNADGIAGPASASSNYVMPVGPLADAINQPAWTIATGGGANWYGQGVYSHDGSAAAQSPSTLSNNSSSFMQTTVTGPATLGFWWKVSSASGYGKLRFYLDGVEQTGVPYLTGNMANWAQVSGISIPSGSHTVRWEYSVMSAWVGSKYQNCGWVDQVTLTPLNPPGAPSNVTASAIGSGQAKVDFSIPASDGNSPIIGYTVSSIPSGGIDTNAGSPALSHAITGLTNGVSYQFTITATNAAGLTGPPSTVSNSVIPSAGSAAPVPALNPVLLIAAGVVLCGMLWRRKA
jgi:hypothetical protein